MTLDNWWRTKTDGFRVTVLIGTALVGVVVAWLAWGLWLVSIVAARWRTSNSVTAPTISDLGQIGDIFGGVNALFAALAFVGVAVAAYLQSQQMAELRRQVKLAEKEHVRQSFEPLFFQLLSLNRTLLSEMRLVLPHAWNSTANNGPIPRAAISIRERMAQRWGEFVQTNNVDLATAPYRELYTANEHELGPYFRTLYHLFRLVDESNLPPAEQTRFSNIARGTLGRDTLLFLTLNCLTPQGAGFKKLVESYGLLKHVNRDNGPTFEETLIEKHYAPTATMSREERLAHTKGE